MASTFTANINLEEPARGDDVGTWDTPVNNNMTLVDLVAGGQSKITLNNANVTLSAAQFQSNIITFQSTLTGSVTITFPSTFKKPYTVEHLCTGSSAFTITLQTTVAGGQAIVCPPGQGFDCYNDGTNLKFKNLGPQVGGYWDYCGSSVPAWVSGCTVPPYLNCDGTTFSSATYPQLTVIMGGTTLPDLRGRVRGYLNQGTGRMTSSGGVDGNTLFASGGGQTTTLSSLHLPQLSDPGHLHTENIGGGSGSVNAVAFLAGDGATNNTSFNTTQSAKTGITYGSSSQIGAPVVQPTAIGGLTLIRAG
jgi:hypothetical protein